MDLADWLTRVVDETKKCEKDGSWPGDNQYPQAADAVLKSLGSPHNGNDTVSCLIAILIEIISDHPCDP